MKNPGNPPPIVIFDLDGTLIDSLPDLARSGAELLRGYGLRAPSAEDVRPMIGDGVVVLVQRLLAWAGGDGVDVHEAVRRFLAIYEPRATLLTHPFAGALETLEVLRERGVACAVCTNKPVAAAADILRRFGIAALLAGFSGGDSFPVRKPDPEHVRRTILAAGGDPYRAVMVGDHRNDVRAGSGAGATTIFARWGYGPAEMGTDATFQAASIGEVPDLVKLIFSSDMKSGN